MIEGVGELHENKLIHRDLKLDNILIQSDMNIVVCDFGLVVECKDENGNDKKIN
jgi:serine/threonine protein kinase